MYQSEFESWKRFEASNPHSNGLSPLRPRLMLQEYLERQRQQRTVQTAERTQRRWTAFRSHVLDALSRLLVRQHSSAKERQGNQVLDV
jgi:galactokinase